MREQRRICRMLPMTTSAGEPSRSIWHRLVREPALHFVILGLLFFGVHRAVHRRTSRNDIEPIVVATPAITAMRDELTRSLGRAPTDAELRVRIEHTIDDEVLY